MIRIFCIEFIDIVGKNNKDAPVAKLAERVGFKPRKACRFDADQVYVVETVIIS